MSAVLTEHQAEKAIAHQFNEEEMAAINDSCVEAVLVNDIYRSEEPTLEGLPEWVVEAINNEVINFGRLTDDPATIALRLPEGEVTVHLGDWLIKGDDGAIIPFHPTNPSIDNKDVIEVISHHLVGGVYLREMRIKDGFKVKQHAHTYDHTSLLSKGCVLVDADGQQETYYAPAIITIKKGIQHEVTPVNGDAHWTCAHKTGEKDIARLDEVLIEKQKEA
jgi:quercetin dioxygenase-like cupin family protein